MTTLDPTAAISAVTALQAVADDAGHPAAGVLAAARAAVAAVRACPASEVDETDEAASGWSAVDTDGNLLVAGPAFVLLADAADSTFTVTSGDTTWTLGPDTRNVGGWRAMAVDSTGSVADFTLGPAGETDNRDVGDTDRIDDRVREILESAVDYEQQLFDAAEETAAAGQVAVARAPVAAPTADPGGASTSDDGGSSGGGFPTGVAAVAATVATGAVVAKVRQAMGDKPSAAPPPPPPPPPPAEPVWRCTHVVPAPGMAAWTTPDGNLPPVTQLAAGVQLQVVQVNNGWAEVVGHNGWRGWVDHRLLVPAP